MTPSNGRVEAFGHQLLDVHNWLRDELAAVRSGAADYRSGAPLRELRTHCATFCSALNRHHRGEDATAFGALAAHFPELGPVIDDLRRDHRIVEESLARLEALVAVEAGDAVAVEREVDSLAALIETHFTYEERRIAAALNSLDIPAWTDAPPDFLRTDPPEPAG
ncbi:hemerythrin domain-containing protein [Nocardiopsis coralliicola]